MQGVASAGGIGEVKVYTTSGRGLNVDELADMAMPKILHIADTAPDALKEQAHEFQEKIRKLLIAYMSQAIRSDRTTLFNQLKNAGYAEAAEAVLKI